MSEAELAVGTLEAAALKRKERLAALRNKSKAAAGATHSENAGSNQLPKPVFRSYKPETRELEEAVLPAGRTSEVVDHVQDELSKEKEGVVVNELDFMNLAPRKPDWDLKRDVASKLDKLERRTQKAIAELIRERLRDDAAAAIASGAGADGNLANAVAEAESLANQEDQDY